MSFHSKSLGPRGLLSIVAALSALVLFVPVVSAKTYSPWGAAFSNGSVTVTGRSDGSGTAKLVLKALPKSKLLAVSIRRGKCSSLGTAIINLPAYRTTSGGALTKSVAVTSATITKIRAASSAVVTLKAGTWHRCAALKGTLPPTGVVWISDGVYRVGTDIQPGTYRIRRPAGGCYWERLRGFGGTLDEIIANGYTNGYAVVTIDPSDVGFHSSGCGVWSSDLSRVTDGSTFGEGTFIVGTDIQPGTYRSTGLASCYWERLSGFGGTLDDIIANDNVDGPAIVTVSATDVGFASSRCGTWNPVGEAT